MKVLADRVISERVTTPHQYISIARFNTFLRNISPIAIVEFNMSIRDLAQHFRLIISLKWLITTQSVQLDKFECNCYQLLYESLQCICNNSARRRPVIKFVSKHYPMQHGSNLPYSPQIHRLSISLTKQNLRSYTYIINIRLKQPFDTAFRYHCPYQHNPVIHKQLS